VTEELVQKYAIPSGARGAVILLGESAQDVAEMAALEGSVVSRVESDHFEKFVTSPDELMGGIEAVKALGDSAASFRVLGQDNRYKWVRVHLGD